MGSGDGGGGAVLPDHIISQKKGETPTPEETVTAHKVTLLWLRATRLDAGVCWTCGLLHTKSLHRQSHTA